MAVPNDEYRNRWNMINELRNVTDSARALGLPYSTMAKWYHDHKDEFPESVKEAIKANSGRRAIRSRPAYSYAVPMEDEELQEEWRVRRPNDEERADLSEDGPKSANTLVDALLSRFEGLKKDNERMFLENKALREENARLRGRVSQLEDRVSLENSDKLRELLKDVELNNVGAD